MTTGVIFGLLVVAHLWRIVAESRSLATNPSFVAITLVAGLLSVWSGLLLRRAPSPRSGVAN
ncbi:MAG: hypothetical protein M3068_04540 [Gemmatimonadota bacterium]|nr:hypothetical protein [Gemmatimonadota bacterium]